MLTVLSTPSHIQSDFSQRQDGTDAAEAKVVRRAGSEVTAVQPVVGHERRAVDCAQWVCRFGRGGTACDAGERYDRGISHSSSGSDAAGNHTHSHAGSRVPEAARETIKDFRHKHADRIELTV